MSIEKAILSNLVYSDEYTRKVIPFLHSDYFTDPTDRVLFGLINDYVNSYNACPSKEALEINLSDVTGLSEDGYRDAVDSLEKLRVDTTTRLDWLLDQTEKFCQERAIYNAIMKSIDILDDKTGRSTTGAIPKLLSDALAVSFDSHVGHDFLEDAAERFEFYHRKVSKIPFDLELMNRITMGGVERKTINVALAGCVHPETKVKIRYRKRV